MNDCILYSLVYQGQKVQAALNSRTISPRISQKSSSNHQNQVNTPIQLQNVSLSSSSFVWNLQLIELQIANSIAIYINSLKFSAFCKLLKLSKLHVN